MYSNNLARAWRHLTAVTILFTTLILTGCLESDDPDSTANETTPRAKESATVEANTNAVVATIYEDGTLNLEWPASTDAVEYVIYRDAEYLASVETPFFKDETPGPGELSYEIEVVKSNGDGMVVSSLAPALQVPISEILVAAGFSGDPTELASSREGNDPNLGEAATAITTASIDIYGGSVNQPEPGNTDSPVPPLAQVANDGQSSKTQRSRSSGRSDARKAKARKKARQDARKKAKAKARKKARIKANSRAELRSKRIASRKAARKAARIAARKAARKAAKKAESRAKAIAQSKAREKAEALALVQLQTTKPRPPTPSVVAPPKAKTAAKTAANTSDSTSGSKTGPTPGILPKSETKTSVSKTLPISSVLPESATDTSAGGGGEPETAAAIAPADEAVEAEAQAAAAARAKAEAEEKKQAKAEADARAEALAQEKAEAEAKKQAKAEADARAEALAQEKAEAEAIAKAQAAAKAEAIAYENAQAEAQAVLAAKRKSTDTESDNSTGSGETGEFRIRPFELSKLYAPAEVKKIKAIDAKDRSKDWSNYACK